MNYLRSMQLFLVEEIQGESAFLGEEETRHCIKVLRKNLGDILDLIDGKGSFFKGEIVGFSKKQTELKILETTPEIASPISFFLAFAPTKNINRTEWMVEKCTEIGTSTFLPFFSEHSERTKLRLDRLEKIVLSATKQSIKAKIPDVKDAISFTDLLKRDFGSRKKLICVVQEGLPYIASEIKEQKEFVIAIGPEGGFSEKEIELAKSLSWVPVSLGKARLRTETAGVVACQVANMAFEFP